MFFYKHMKTHISRKFKGLFGCMLAKHIVSPYLTVGYGIVKIVSFDAFIGAFFR